MQVDYHGQIWREGAGCIAHALPLDVASAGPTPEAARQALGKAVRLFLDTAASQGTLDEVLEEAGYQRQDAGNWRGRSGLPTSIAGFWAELEAFYLHSLIFLFLAASF